MAFKLPVSGKGAGLVLAFFPILAGAGEWEEYKDLKAAMVRSEAKRDHSLPRWIVAEPFRPRPWDVKTESEEPPVVTITPPPEVAHCVGKKCVPSSY